MGSDFVWRVSFVATFSNNYWQDQKPDLSAVFLVENHGDIDLEKLRHCGKNQIGVDPLRFDDGGVCNSHGVGGLNALSVWDE
ncbi:MAG: hypothetical protein FD128_2883 [Hyphomonadaceae bacterium]|nr:MAG: hypothetical protein FD128_2883 [Hyphomonadaceae bacterium]